VIIVIFAFISNLKALKLD